MRSLLAFALAFCAATSTAPAAADPPAVDVQLVLAIDSSSSVNIDEFYLQLEGYAAAFRHPDLLRAIQSGQRKAVAVTLFEWSGSGHQVVNLPWRVLSNEEDLKAFAADLEGAPRLVVGGETALGDAIDFGVRLFELGIAEGGRRVIDVSGDGISNGGRETRAARDDATFLGVSINGVAILNEVADLDAYFRANVIGGAGAFALPAQDYEDFRDVILKKLVREISTISAAPAPPTRTASLGRD